MPKQSRQQQLYTRLEQAKRKLKLDAPNPFETVRKNTRQKVLNKQDNQFGALPHVTPQSEHEIRQQLAENILQKQEKRHFAISEAQQVYNEVAQKSKQFRQERKQTKEQVEKNVQKFDYVAYKIASILPPRQYGLPQGKLELELEAEQVALVQPQKLKITQADAIRQGALRLQELQRERKAEIKQLDLHCGDDDEFGEIKSDVGGAACSDLSEFSEGREEAGRVAADSDADGDAGESKQPISEIPYILYVPATFPQFQKLLSRVPLHQEIVLYDRMIKANSTALDAKNAPDCERLAKFAFRRFILTANITRMDCAMRCLRHLANEIPTYAAQIFKEYFSQYRSADSVQFALVLRLFLICFPAGETFVAHLDNVTEIAALTAESVIQRVLDTLPREGEKARLKRLSVATFLVQQLALLSINVGRFDGAVFGFCASVLQAFGDYAWVVANEDVYPLDVRALRGKREVDVSPQFVFQNVRGVVQFYCAVFYIPASMLCDPLKTLVPPQIPQMASIGLIQQKAPQISQFDPVYAMNFNPKRGLDVDLQKARSRAKEKAEHRKQRDDARRVLKEKRREIATRQAAAAAKAKDRRKVLNAIQGEYQQDVVSVKKLNVLEKLGKEGKARRQKK